ncbi:MAG: methyltransferase [Methylovulum sp.]
MQSAKLLHVPQGDFQLTRLPKQKSDVLQAFDAADEYILTELAEKTPLTPQSRVLIFNDSFGALAIALHKFTPTAVSDSYLSQHATRLNLLANGLTPDDLELLDSLTPLSGHYDVVLLKVPKNLALLEEQLLRLRQHISTSSNIILGGMVKLLPATVWKLVEKILGTTTTSLAKKKARLIFVAFNPQLPELNNPYPTRYTLENTAYTLVNHANVFSRDHLDIGTRFFLQHLPSSAMPSTIVDLGCGNGVVGLIAAERNPHAIIHFVDESFMAVASAQENFETVWRKERASNFYVGDGLVSFADESVDLVLCNPPFHQHNIIGSYIAITMFAEAARVLTTTGQLWVIGNRHLNYQQILPRWFSRVERLAMNDKFVILKAYQR